MDQALDDATYPAVFQTGRYGTKIAWEAVQLYGLGKIALAGLKAVGYLAKGAKAGLAARSLIPAL